MPQVAKNTILTMVFNQHLAKILVFTDISTYIKIRFLTRKQEIYYKLKYFMFIIKVRKLKINGNFPNNLTPSPLRKLNIKKHYKLKYIISFTTGYPLQKRNQIDVNSRSTKLRENLAVESNSRHISMLENL